MIKDIKRISFSELKNWKECPYRHKLIYIDKLPYYSGNEYTAFGTAIHEVCEKILLDETLDPKPIFLKAFARELDTLKKESIETNPSLIEEMKLQADYIYDKIIPTVKETFTDFSVFSVEEPLLEDIVEFDSRGRKFKGFIDLVIKTPDEKYHIIDWKSCSWGWTRDKKNSKMTTYQLTYYKNYFCQKHKIDPKFVDTYFALLKRTAKKENVEIFKVSSGDKKTTNSLKLLENAVINIERKVSIKNRLSCKYCKFYKTEHCE